MNSENLFTGMYLWFKRSLMIIVMRRMKKKLITKVSIGANWKKKRKKKRRRGGRGRGEGEEEKEEEEDQDKQIEDGIQSVDRLSTDGFDAPDNFIDLRKQQSKEIDQRVLYREVKEQEAHVAPGTLLGTTHTYTILAGTTQDKSSTATGAKRVELLRSQKTDKVDIALASEELEEMDNVLPAKYDQAMEEEKLRNRREDFSDMVAENAAKKRKRMEKEAKSKKNIKDSMDNYKF